MLALSRTKSFLRALFRKRQIDAELDDEICSTLELLADQKVQQGMAPAEATRAARLEIGGVEQLKESIRAARAGAWLDTLLQDLRFGLRMLGKNPGFTAVAILTLTLGIGACTVVFSAYYNLFFNGFAAKDASRLVVPLIQNADAVVAGGVRASDTLIPCSSANFDAVRQAFEDLVCSIHRNILLNDGRETRQLDGAFVSANAFDFYGVPALLGRGIVPGDAMADASPVFVMSYRMWRGEFDSNPRILGESFTVDDEPRTLVGIMPARFHAFGPSQVDIWMPENIHNASDPSNGNLVLGRLKPGENVAAASRNLSVIVGRLAQDEPGDFPKHFSAYVEPASDFLMGHYGIGDVFGSSFSAKRMVYGLFAGVLLLLLLACCDVANLLLARATAREKEIAIRAALGATRGRLFRQLLVESSLLAVAACVLGCALAHFALKTVTAWMPQNAIFGVVGGEAVLGLNLPVLCFTLGITLMTTLVCGVAPALRVSGSIVSNAKGLSEGPTHGRIRAALVVSEVSLSVILLAGAGLIVRSFLLLTHADLGFEPRNVFLVVFQPRGILRVPADQVQFVVTRQNQRFVQALKSVPGVESVAIDDTIAGYGGGRGSQVAVPGSARFENAGLDPCDENLFQTLGLRMVRGRWLSKADVDSRLYVAVINKTMARKIWGDENPVGQQLQVKSFRPKDQQPRDAYFQIVGVVGDLKNVGPEQPALPEAFIPYTIQDSGVSVLLRTRVDADSLLHPIEQRVWTIDPDATFVFAESLEDFLDTLSYAVPRFGAMTVAPLAGIALLLVMSGVFSVMAYAVSLQTREIGIRAALGAQRDQILRAVLGKGVALITSGIILGVGASLGLTRFLASQIGNLSPTDPWTFGLVIVVIVAAGLAACWIPARRAMRVDPIVALRYE